MVKLIVQGIALEITEADAQLMEKIDDLRLIEGNQVEEINLEGYALKTIQRILELSKLVNYKFPVVDKVKGSKAFEYIGHLLTNYFKELTYVELHQLFKATHFLKHNNLKKCVVAYMSCQVYIPLSLKAYNQKMAELKITKPLSNKVSTEYKNKYLFLVN